MFLKNNKINRLISVFILIFVVYLFIAFISYISNWQVDQSYTDLSFSELVTNNSVKVENIGGKFGLVLSNLFIAEGFGVSSFLFLALIVLVFLKSNKVYIPYFSRIIKSLLVTIIFLSIIIGFFEYDSSYIYSGIHGRYIAQFLVSGFGIIGAIFIISFLIITTLAFLFENFSRKLFYSIVKKLNIKSKVLQPKEKIIEEIEEDKDYEYSDIKIATQKNPKTKNKKTSFPEIESDFKEVGKPTSKPHKEKNKDGGLELEVTHKKEEEGVEIVEVSKEVIEEDNTTGIESQIDTPDTTIVPHVVNLDEPYDPKKDLALYEIPALSLLKAYEENNSEVDSEELKYYQDKIVQTLFHYGITIVKIKATIGPTITLYEIIPEKGTRISRIKNLEDDIAMSLAADGIRIIAPMPGKGTVGIEVPNKNPEIVSMRSILASKKFQESKYNLPIAIGKTINNETFVFDLAKSPHLLMAGATGQGKSVGINAIITSLLYKKHPSELKFVLIDPKKVELSLYDVISKHYLAKEPNNDEVIINDTKKVINTLNSLCVEMDNRYNLLQKAYTRNINEYNTKFKNRKLNPNNGHKFLPFIVVVIDEFADLIMTAGKEIEYPIARIAQLARAVGIHMIIATQRPSTNIITGTIKANFPTRIAFKVSSMIDSRTILDSPGANKLIGRGDMLYSFGTDKVRIQCAFIDTPELEEILAHIGEQQSYPSVYELPEYSPEGADEESKDIDLKKRDGKFEEAARLLVLHQQGSTSLIQRKLEVGYNRAGRIIDQLEAADIVGPFKGSKAREVLVPDEMQLEALLRTLP